MNRCAVTVCAASAIALTGCVQRRIEITSEPEGARVWLNDQDVGITPVEVDFTWYGVYDVRLHKQGYEPLVTKAEAKAPFYEWPGVDLVAMAVPVTKKTRIAWHFDLTPASENDASLLERAKELRQRELQVSEPAQPSAPEADSAPDSTSESPSF